VIATQRAFAVRTERRLFDIGLYLEMNGSGTRDDPFDFTDDPILGASPASPGSGSLESEESGETVSIKSVRRTGYTEGFSEAENCKENVVESINTISLFWILKKCN